MTRITRLLAWSTAAAGLFAQAPHYLGIAAQTPTQSRNPNLARQCAGKPSHIRLTDSEKQVVSEINRLGMIVDIPHVSDKAFYAASAVPTKPVIASHSSSRHISDIP